MRSISVGRWWCNAVMTMIDEKWFRTLDCFGKVGSRHHVVPTNACGRSRNRTASRASATFVISLSQVFYTLVADDGHLDAHMEEVLSVVEEYAAVVLRQVNNPFATQTVLTPREFGDPVDFVAFQMTRSPRRRRKYELMADWSGKTMAATRWRRR